LEAASVVLRTPTLIWVYVGGALVTFAVNGLIAWASSFMQRVHGMTVTDVGRNFGLWALAGSSLGALFGGRMGDALMRRWVGGGGVGRAGDTGGAAYGGTGHGEGARVNGRSVGPSDCRTVVAPTGPAVRLSDRPTGVGE